MTYRYVKIGISKYEMQVLFRCNRYWINL